MLSINNSLIFIMRYIELVPSHNENRDVLQNGSP